MPPAEGTPSAGGPRRASSRCPRSPRRTCREIDAVLLTLGGSTTGGTEATTLQPLLGLDTATFDRELACHACRAGPRGRHERRAERRERHADPTSTGRGTTARATSRRSAACSTGALTRAVVSSRDPAGSYNRLVKASGSVLLASVVIASYSLERLRPTRRRARRFGCGTTKFQAAVAKLARSGGTIRLQPSFYRTLVVPPRSGRRLRIIGRPGVRIQRLVFDRTRNVSLARGRSRREPSTQSSRSTTPSTSTWTASSSPPRERGSPRR